MIKMKYKEGPNLRNKGICQHMIGHQNSYIHIVTYGCGILSDIEIYFLSEKQLNHRIEVLFEYRKVASSSKSRLEAHAGFFKLLMKGIFGHYVL